MPIFDPSSRESFLAMVIVPPMALAKIDDGCRVVVVFFSNRCDQDRVVDPVDDPPADSSHAIVDPQLVNAATNG